MILKKAVICIVGLGYVGTANAVLLAQKNEVTCYDLDFTKSNNLVNGIPAIDDKDIKDFLNTKKLNLIASKNFPSKVNDFNFVIIATPTNYDIDTNQFDTTSIEKTLENIQKSESTPCVIIRSTIPVGYVKKIKRQ